jgi:predicted PurR-regulated permease PerM
MDKSQTEVKERLEKEIDYTLKLSQIFASIFIGFGIILFSFLTNYQNAMIDSNNLMINLQRNMLEIIKLPTGTNTESIKKNLELIESGSNLINSQSKSMEILSYFFYPLLGFFIFFFIMSIFYYECARSSKKELSIFLKSIHCKSFGIK